MGVLPNRFMTDSLLHTGAQLVSGGTQVHPVDPLLVLHTHLIFKRGALAKERGLRSRQCTSDNLLRKLQNGSILALPYNLPEDVHWIAVFAWLGDDGMVNLCHANSMRGYNRAAWQALRNARNLLRTLYRNRDYRPPDMDTLSFKTVKCTVPQQPSGSCACGEHTVAAIALAARGLLQSHTFSLQFVSHIRQRIVASLIRHRPRGRRQLRLPCAEDNIPMIRKELRFDHVQSLQSGNRPKKRSLRKTLIFNTQQAVRHSCDVDNSTKKRSRRDTRSADHY